MSEIHFLKSDEDDTICYLDDDERVLLVTPAGAENHCIDVDDDVIVCDGKIFWHKSGTPAGVFVSDRGFDWYENYISRAYVYGIDALFDSNVMLSGRPGQLWDYHVCVLPDGDSDDVIFCATDDNNPDAVRYSMPACETRVGCKQVSVGCVVRVEKIPADCGNPLKKMLHRALSAIAPSPLMRDNCDDAPADDGDDC